MDFVQSLTAILKEYSHANDKFLAKIFLYCPKRWRIPLDKD